jgi:hypothetical protein
MDNQQDIKKELRKAHFHFGSDAATYETTHQQQFVEGGPQRSQTELNMLKNAQVERKIKMRQ